MRYSDPRPLKSEVIRENEENKSGIYILLNRYKNPIYVGHSKNLQHRLKAIVYGRADYDQIKNKADLRREAKYYRRAYMHFLRARQLERKKKEDMKYNVG